MPDVLQYRCENLKCPILLSFLMPDLIKICILLVSLHDNLFILWQF